MQDICGSEGLARCIVANPHFGRRKRFGTDGVFLGTLKAAEGING